MKEWKYLSKEQRQIVRNLFVTGEDRNKSDRVSPREEDIIDYYKDNEDWIFAEYRPNSEEDNYRYIHVEIFKGDSNCFNAWLLAGEPHKRNGEVDEKFDMSVEKKE